MRCQGFGLFIFSHVNVEICCTIPRVRDLERLAVCGGHHLALALASDVGSAAQPRAKTCESKSVHRDSGRLPEARVVEKRQPFFEMLLGAGEVTTPIARYNLELMHGAEIDGTALSEGELEGLVEDRASGG